MESGVIIFALIFIRVFAMFISSPVFSMGKIPNLVKLGISVVIAYIVFGLTDMSLVQVPQTAIELVLTCTKEVLVGLSIGMTANIIFTLVKISGQLMDISAGFSMSQYYDPVSGSPATPIEKFCNWLTIMVFFSCNFHQVVISATIKSFSIIPAGVSSINFDSFYTVVDIFASNFRIAVQLAAPIILVLFICDFAMGILSRAVPQFHIFMLSMPLKVLVCMAALAAILPGLVHMYSKTFENISGGLIQYLKSVPVLFILAADDKTEEPTPKKLQDARKKGQVPKSTDLNSSIILIALTLSLILFGEYYYTNGKLFIIEGLSYVASFGAINSENVFSIFKFALKNAVLGAAPIALVSMTAGIIGNIVQTGFILSGEGLKLKLEKLNPIQGFKRFFSKRTFFEFIKTLLKLFIIGYGGYTYVKGKLTKILTTSDLNTGGVYPFAKSLVDSFLIRMCLLIFIIGIADFIYQKRQYMKDMRMTKEEVKEEYKQTEGNPEIKSKQKQKQRQLASRRMLKKVPTATVVITNPTHIAVAIKYDKNISIAPIVVAKGADMTAQRIKDIAKENNVPIVENKPVARMLFYKVEIDEAIPVELYQAVAEIIAYVYSLKKM